MDSTRTAAAFPCFGCANFSILPDVVPTNMTSYDAPSTALTPASTPTTVSLSAMLVLMKSGPSLLDDCTAQSVSECRLMKFMLDSLIVSLAAPAAAASPLPPRHFPGRGWGV